MSFLIRAAFWLSLVILILPADPGSEEIDQSLSTSQALIAAQAALSDFTAFCSRQPDVCEAGEVALESFAAKARYGAKQLYVYLDDQPNEKGAIEGQDSITTGTIATEAKTGAELTDTRSVNDMQGQMAKNQQQLTALVSDLQN